MALHIFPLMFLATVSHQILRVTSSGLLGVLVFPALALFIGLDYLILRFLWKGDDKEPDMKTDPDPDPEASILGKNENDEDQTTG